MSPGTESSQKAFRPPPDSGIEVVEDAWLGERFGHPVFTVRVTSDTPDAEALRELMEEEAGPDLASYQARLDATAIETLADFQVFFDVVGGTLTLACPTGAGDLPASPVSVRSADPERDEVVGEIAGRAFSGSRFHTDFDIPDSVADAIKRDWTLNLLSGERGDGIWVATNQDAVVGFLGRVSAPDGAAVIDLVAVDPEARSTGAGAALVRRFLEDARERGQNRARVGTQLANPRALAFYERLGFRAQKAEVDLHMHVGEVWADPGLDVADAPPGS